MDTALAMKYGGAPVSPDECDETSYKALGLICACCRDVVRWVPTQERQVKGAFYPVKSHFRHFPSKDPVVAANCERRVSVLSKQEVERMARKAVQQRAALFQRWFWTVINAHITRTELSEDGIMDDVLFFKGEFSDLRPSDRLEGIIECFGKHGVSCVQQSVLNNLEEIAGWDESVFCLEAKVEDDVLPQWMANVRHLATHRLHKHIACEAIAFLGAKRNKALLRALMFWIIFPGELDPLMKEGQEDELTAFLFSAIGWLIALIPWADEFKRLEMRDEIAETGHSFTGAIWMEVMGKKILELQAKQGIQPGSAILLH